MIYKRILHNYVKSVVEYLMIWEDSLISEKKQTTKEKTGYSLFFNYTNREKPGRGVTKKINGSS